MSTSSYGVIAATYLCVRRLRYANEIRSVVGASRMSDVELYASSVALTGGSQTCQLVGLVSDVPVIVCVTSLT